MSSANITKAVRNRNYPDGGEDSGFIQDVKIIFLRGFGGAALWMIFRYLYGINPTDYDC